MDAYAYIENNITLTQLYGDNYDGVILNITQSLGGSFASVPLQCFLFATQWYADISTKAVLYGTIGNYLLSFLFNQMGNALSFNTIFNEINQDEENQYYTDIAY